MILPANSPIPCSAIVLAGGLATRLGGVDKALVPLAGRPLLAHVLERLQPQCDDIVINHNRDSAEMREFGHRLVPDRRQDYAGPLAGIAAALPFCAHDLVLVVPCDCPFLPVDLYARLAAAMTADNGLALAHDGERLQPLFMLLRRDRLRALEHYLEGGSRKVEGWCLAQNPALVHFTDSHAFMNINTPEELDKAEQMLRQ